MTQVATVIPEPAAPPRQATARVRRRAWAEPHVRFWWVGAAVLLAISAYFGLTELWAWWRDVRLIRTGAEVPALVEKIGGNDISWATGRPQLLPAPVKLSFQWNGQKREVERFLESRGSSDYLTVGSTIPLRVNPQDPDQWTHRTAPPPLLHGMIPAILPLPVVGALAVVALLLRRRLLRIWREGEAQPALVVSTQQTALAPRSRSVRCTPADESDSRVFNVYVPARAGVLSQGDVIWLIFPQKGRARPLAAAWFE